MHLSTLLLFSLVALIAIATPGPTVLLALSNGSHHGVRLALAGMVGAMASDVVLVCAVALGLGALLAASEFWFTVLKWAGAVYLAWLGLRMLRSQGSLTLPDASGNGQAPEVTRRSLFLRSFLVAVTNPKGYLFCSALMPQFIDSTQPQLAQWLAIGVVFVALDFVVMLGYALIGAHAVRALSRRAVKWLDRGCGGALLALAGSLALMRRASTN